MVDLNQFIKGNSESENISIKKNNIKIEEIKPETLWNIKYCPKKADEFVGQKKSIDKIKNFLTDFNSKKGLIVFGPTGTGKSCVGKVLAEEYDLELIELNASDQRNKQIIEQQLGNIIKQKSLFGKGKLILLDDLDGISGTKDRGGAQAISKMISESSFPILITCQDPFIDKLKSVRKKCVVIEFEKINEKEIKERLKQILLNENILFDEKDLDIIAKNSEGDLRAAINDLQMLSSGKNKLDFKILDEIENRIKKSDMKQAIHNIFKSKQAIESIGSFDNVSGDPLQEAPFWLDYNIPLEYKLPLDRAMAYGYLTKADVFKSRILRRQNWRLLVYINALLTSGITISKSKEYLSNIEYNQSTRALKIWQANMKYGRRKAIAEKIAEKIHCSSKKVINNFEFYSHILIKDKTNELELDKDDLDYLNKIANSV